METKTRNKLLIAYLSVGVMLTITGYQTESFQLSTVLSDLKDHQKDVFYRSMKLIKIGAVVTNIVTIAFVKTVKPKPVLLITSFVFTMYQLGFQKFDQTYYLVTSGLLGLCLQAFHGGKTRILNLISDSDSYQTHTGILWLITNCNFILGNAITILQNINDSNDIAYVKKSYEIFSTTSIIANIMFLGLLLIPLERKTEGEQVEEEPKARKSWTEYMSNKGRHFWEVVKFIPGFIIRRDLILLMIMFGYLGIFSSFTHSVLPVYYRQSMGFDFRQRHVSLYAIAVGSGECCVGLLFILFAEKIGKTGRLLAVQLALMANFMVLLALFYVLPNAELMAGKHKYYFKFIRRRSSAELMFHTLLGSGFAVGMIDGILSTVTIITCNIHMKGFKVSALAMCNISKNIVTALYYYFKQEIRSNDRFDKDIGIQFTLLIFYICAFTLIIYNPMDSRVRRQHRKIHSKPKRILKAFFNRNLDIWNHTRERNKSKRGIEVEENLVERTRAAPVSVWSIF